MSKNVEVVSMQVVPSFESLSPEEQHAVMESILRKLPTFEKQVNYFATRVLEARFCPTPSKTAPQVRAINQLVSGHYTCAGQCLFIALMNARAIYAGIGLHLVIGALGFGLDVPSNQPAGIHWEFGSAATTRLDQVVQADGRSTDIHVWLEDSNGKIYDILYVDYLVYAMVHSRRLSPLKLLPAEPVNAVSHEDMRKRGFHYHAYSAELQQQIWDHVLKEMSLSFASIGFSNDELPRKICDFRS